MIRLASTGACVVATVSHTIVLHAAELRRGDDDLNLVLQTDGSLSDAATFGSRAKITAASDGFSLGLGASAQLGRELDHEEVWTAAPPAGPTSFWRSTDLSAGARWTSSDVQIGLDAGRSLRWSETADQALPFSLGRFQSSVRDETSAALNIGLRLSDAVKLQVGSRTRRWWQAAEVGAGVSDQYGASENSLSVGTNWRISPALTLDVGASMSRNDLAWHGDLAARSQQSSLQPRLSATVQQGGTRLRLSVERIVSPIAVDDLRSSVVDAGESSLRPAEEWRQLADVEWRIDEMFTLSAQLAFADQERSIELSAGPGGAVRPVNVAAGSRNWASIGLSANLDALGVEGAKLIGRSEWRRSEVVDPLSHEARRASGERPYEGRLEFRQSPEGTAFAWGLDAYVSGPARYYRPRDVTHSDAVAGLGGFLSYSPSTLSLQMRVDNLLGGERRSTTEYYSGIRTDGAPVLVDRVAEEGRRISISVTKKL